MMATSTNSDSINILSLIEKGTVGAEIGVWKASTSRLFLKKQPAKLYLVDPWSTGPYIAKAQEEGFDLDGYYKRYAKFCGGSEDADFQRMYEKVAQKVAGEFGDFDNVEIRRELSGTFFASLDDNYLDWVYVDGDHTFSGCYRDLVDSLRVVKEGGLIICDDYTFTTYGKSGVTEAVNKFVKENNLKIEQFGNNQAVIRL